MLLTHGYSQSGRMWDRNVPALTDDRVLITWDLRGHGGSDSPDDPAAYAHEACLVQHDAAAFEGLGEISVQTLIVVGSEDELFLPAADVMERRIRGARKIVLEGAGHMASVDAPNEFNAAVNDFLEGL